MPFTVTVKDPETRKAEIGALCSQSPSVRRCYEMSSPTDLPVIRLDNRTPIYRMANFRTHSRQQDRIRTHNLDKNWFEAGQENELQQNAQHDLLKALAARGSGKKITPLMDALRRDGNQKQPLLITRDGVVVNGNRRLAAMRELYSESASDFSEFAQIEAMVLPAHVDQAEIKRIEVRLQMTPQTLLPYDWIDQAQAVRELMAEGFEKGEVADLMQLTDQAVTQILGRLDEADLYLEECAKKPGEYLSIMSEQQHFEEMEKGLRNKDGAAKILARRIGQSVLHNGKDLGQRIYDYRVLWNQNFERAVPLLAESLGVFPDDVIPDEEDADDLFGGGSNDFDEWTSLGAALIDPDRRKEVSTALRNTGSIIFEENRGATALEKLKRIRSQITNVELSEAAPETFDEMLIELTGIMDTAGVIKANIEERKSAL